MNIVTSNAMPVIRAVSLVLAHVPSLVRLGSKPLRVLREVKEPIDYLRPHLRDWDAARTYAPNQVFIGNLGVDDLATRSTPWHRHPLAGAGRFGLDGEIMPEDEFLGLLAACEGFDLLALDRDVAERARVAAEDVRYVISCGEEAVGDRYQRGGGNLAKAVAEWAGCARATGSDVKAFCCAPMHALMLAGALVRSGLHDDVMVVAGGSLAKLGMKFQGHVKHAIPIVEDVLAGFAVHVARDDGVSPVLRLDAIGRHEVASGSAPLAIMKA